MFQNKLSSTALLILLCSTVLSCSSAESGQSSNLSDAVETIEKDIIEEPDIVLWTPEPEEPDPECIDCKMYFCPPLDSIWQKEICMNICDDPATLYS